MPGVFDGGVDNVVDVAEREVVIEEVAEEFDDSTQGAVSDEDQAECELADPVFGDGEVEQDGGVGRRRVEGLVEGYRPGESRCRNCVESLLSKWVQPTNRTGSVGSEHAVW